MTDEELKLLDQFAGQAMQSLIRIGAMAVKTEQAPKGHTFDYPDQPFYFGDDLTEGEHGGIGFDAYRIAEHMIKARRERIQDITNPEATPRC